MVEQSAENPGALAWHVAEGMIRAYLPESPWSEDVLRLERGVPGRLEVSPHDGHRRYWFRRCPLAVRRPDGQERERLYSFAFDWSEGRWQLAALPAVCV